MTLSLVALIKGHCTGVGRANRRHSMTFGRLMVAMLEILMPEKYGS